VCYFCKRINNDKIWRLLLLLLVLGDGWGQRDEEGKFLGGFVWRNRVNSESLKSEKTRGHTQPPPPRKKKVAGISSVFDFFLVLFFLGFLEWSYNGRANERFPPGCLLGSSPGPSKNLSRARGQQGTQVARGILPEDYRCYHSDDGRMHVQLPT